MNNEHSHGIRYQNNYIDVMVHGDHVLTSLHNPNIRSSCLTYYKQHRVVFSLSPSHTHPSCSVTFFTEQGQNDTLPPIIITDRQCKDQLLTLKDPWTNRSRKNDPFKEAEKNKDGFVWWRLIYTSHIHIRLRRSVVWSATKCLLTERKNGTFSDSVILVRVMVDPERHAQTYIQTSTPYSYQFTRRRT